MNVERRLPPFVSVAQPQNDWPSSHNTLKRKLGLFVPPLRPGERCYPSPPMSTPPSPPHLAPERPVGPVSESVLPVSGSRTVSSTHFISAPPPVFQSTAPPTQLRALTDHPPSSNSFAGTLGPPFPSFGVLHTGQRSTSADPAFSAGPATAGVASSRPGRKSKTHVASACINCKRAHLSCDVQRPCARCVASGKQVS